MALVPRLDQRQSQSLVMTPQLQQAIKLLQMSNMELSEFITEELEQNPMLEREEADRREDIGAPGVPHPDEIVDNDLDNGNVSAPAALSDMNFEAPAPVELGTTSGLDVDYDNIYTSNGVSDDHTLAATPNQYAEPGFSSSAQSGGGEFVSSAPDLEQVLSELPSLRDHLMEQLTMDLTDGATRMVGIFLMDHLNEAGYLEVDIDDAAAALGCDPELVTETLTRLQHFDPPGIFARDLRECLALQLHDRDRLDPCIATFLDNLELVAAREFKKLEAICQCDSEDITDMIKEIRTLTPKPAMGFDQDMAQLVIPDVLMRPAPSSGWILELNSETLPKVLVNNHYHALVRKKTLTKNEKSYIAEQFQSANWLVKALHQRATTIMKVATELVRQQDGFFTHGVQHLKPLVLRDIADAIEMHESTVSRVTSNKFMATPRGIFELKYFFTPAIASTEGGGAHSAEAVRHRIKELIDTEPTRKILSDDKIVGLLRADGIDIARRTVTKYREAMRIPSSVQRRRDKSAMTQTK